MFKLKAKVWKIITWPYLCFLNVFCKHIFSSSYIKDTFKIMAEITSKSYHIQNSHAYCNIA